MSKKFQIVGSLLRPTELLAYKRQIEHSDTIVYPFYNDLAGYEDCELAATKEIIKKQVDHGLDVISDGEYSKSIWHLDFVWGLKGVDRLLAQHGYFFKDKDAVDEYNYETRKDIALRFTEPFGAKNHHFIKIFKRIASLAEGKTTKLCIPSPSHLFGEFSWSKNIIDKDKIYPTSNDLKNALLVAYKEFVQEYADAGGKILQLDDCLWEMFADDNPNSPFNGENIDVAALSALADEFVELNNAVIDFGHTLGLKMWTHNCRGNYESRHMGGGSYAKIADLFLKQQKYDRFFLEWDDERAGTLDALNAFKGKNNEIVLGLMSSKTNTLDDEDRIFKLLEEASKIIDKDRLFLSHQCGFASCDGGNELTEAEQWAKIDQGQKIAQKFWGV
ncbi:MAG: cobalamin-independent methionine synthase II family protein [Defluviitaleaceae bacterium]|nr:cobalamin-independent methionine synthase II family protein [Defluviitaleaceae bacterium]